MMSERFKPRWCGNCQGMLAGPKVPVQDSREHNRHIPKELAELAYQEYEAQGHGGQSFERLHERDGFGVLEIALPLADALERERARKSR